MHASLQAARLGHQEPIERGLVNGWEVFDLCCVFAHDWQVIGTGRLYAGQSRKWDCRRGERPIIEIIPYV